MNPLILLFCLLPGLASAGNLYRCVDHAGHVSYQTASCPNGQRTDRTIQYIPDPTSIPVTALSTVPDTRSALKPGKRAHKPARSLRMPRTSPCAQAKAKREQQLRRLGFKRSFDDLSRIDADVRAVCKGY